MNQQLPEETSALRKLFEAGADVAGAVGGVAAGLVIAGPSGALAGGAVGPLISHTLRAAVDFTQRQMSRREQARVGATITFALDKINKNLTAGKQLRQDGFFQNQLNDRATADEIVEGVLLIAQREYQEKKLMFYGNLLANIAFDTEIDRGISNQLVRIAERISYRQLTLLSFFVKSNRHMTDYVYLEDPKDNLNTSSIVEEVFDMRNLSVLTNDHGVGSYEASRMPWIVVDKLGLKLYKLMELDKIDGADLAEILKIIGFRGTA